MTSAKEQYKKALNAKKSKIDRPYGTILILGSRYVAGYAPGDTIGAKVYDGEKLIFSSGFAEKLNSKVKEFIPQKIYRGSRKSDYLYYDDLSLVSFFSTGDARRFMDIFGKNYYEKTGRKIKIILDARDRSYL